MCPAASVPFWMRHCFAENFCLLLCFSFEGARRLAAQVLKVPLLQTRRAAEASLPPRFNKIQAAEEVARVLVTPKAFALRPSAVIAASH